MMMLSLTASALALSSHHGRALSYSNILAYFPGSDVADHARIDLDQQALQSAFGSSYDWDAVKAIWEDGAHSKPYATCTFTGTPPTADIDKKKSFTFTTVGGSAGGLKTKSSYTAGDATISFTYVTSEDRVEPAASQCYIGGLANADQVDDGCLPTTASDIVDDTGVNTYSVTCVTAAAGRTLQGFSTKAKELMYDPEMSSSGCLDASADPRDYEYGCPYTSFQPYFDYYCAGTASCNGNGAYVDAIVQAGLSQGATDLANGNMDFGATATFHEGTGVADDAIKEVVKKATAYMSSWMYAIREFEDAIDDCTGTALTNNDLSSGSVHAWDEGVAFYVGSLMVPSMVSGAYSSNDYAGIEDLGEVGVLSYTLANKRCQNFKTCGIEGTDLVGQAKVNYQLMDLFMEGQHEFLIGNCGGVVPIKNRIVQLMSVPLIQGTLRYAYKVGVLNEGTKARGEGAVFAAAILPQVHAADAAAATIIYDNMGLNAAGRPDFAAVKAAFESVYPALGVTCADVGGLWRSDTSDYYDGAEPCSDPSTAEDDALPTWAIAVIVVVGVLALLLFIFVCRLVSREKSGKPIFATLTNSKTGAV